MDHNRDYLISWFHPTEYLPELEIPHWVTGRNEDFGFETRCAVVQAVDPEAAREFVRSHYDLPGFALTFRFCNPYVDFSASISPFPREAKAA